MNNLVLNLTVANARYWTSVAPVVRAQLRRWERRAQEIPDPALRALALQKLREERFNAEVAATLATLAPRTRRARTVQAIVALQLAYDYLDGLTEQPAEDPLRTGLQLSLAFTDALGGTPRWEPDGAGAGGEPAHDHARARGGGPAQAGDYFASAGGEPAHDDTRTRGGEPAQTGDYFAHHPSDDGGYLAELSAATSAALAGLPAWSAVSETARASAELCAEAQVRVHATLRTATAELEQWATARAAGTRFEWREFLAGAVSSVLALHALIAAAASERTTPAQAAAIDSAYLSISALSTMLDGAIDYEADCAGGVPWLVRQYEDTATLADAVGTVIGDAKAQARTLPNAGHHELMLVGVAAYYASAPQAGRGIAAALMGRAREELGPSLGPAIATMRAWRAAKRLRGGAKRRTTPPESVSVDERAAAIERRLTASAGPR